jgi:hypothetical protein
VICNVTRQRSGRGQKKRIPFRLVGWDATLPADHTPTTFATRQGGRQADERAEVDLLANADQHRGGSAALIMRTSTPEAGDGRKWAVSAAGPCTTGEEHCEQATTNGHDAECNLLHDVPSCVPPP